jgi:hypothetical protein
MNTAPTSPSRAGRPHMEVLEVSPGRLPPPLTPPLKGEGDFAAAMPHETVHYWCLAKTPAGPPPPCGEGLGVGVTPYAAALLLSRGGGSAEP